MRFRRPLIILLSCFIFIAYIGALRATRLTIVDYYLAQGRLQQALIWQKKVVRKDMLGVELAGFNSSHSKPDVSVLESLLVREKEERRRKVNEGFAFELQNSVDIKSAMANLLMWLDFSKIEVDYGRTVFVDRMGQRVKVEGPCQLVDGPWEGSRAVMVEGLEGLTKISAPVSALDLNEGSFSVWARLADPKKEYSTLLSVNDHCQIYIYHEGTSGKFYFLYNGLALGASRLSVTDANWHHYVFTWKNASQKFYVDGSEIFSSATSASTSKTSTFYIGWVGTNIHEQWHGPLSQFLTFDRALSSQEITSLCSLKTNRAE